MEYIQIIAVLLIIMVAHELGHALAMRKHGVEIKEFGIGYPWPFKFVLTIRRFPWGGRVLKNFGIAIAPLLPFAAYVEPTAEGQQRMQELPAGARMEISWAGPRANFLLCLVLILTLKIRHGFWVEALITLFIGAVLFSLHRLTIKYRIGLYLFPLLGCLLLGLLIWLIAANPSSNQDALMGPVGIVVTIPKQFPGFWEQLFLLSLSIGFVNLLPIPPLDGGNIMLALMVSRGLSPRIQNLAGRVGTVALILLFLLVTLNDFLIILG